jgi:hypothetical protein
MIDVSSVGARFGFKVRSGIISLGDKIKHKIYSLNFRDFKIIAAGLLFVVIASVGHLVIKDSLTQKQIIRYIEIQDKIQNASSMSNSDIDKEFLKPFSGLFRLNNAVKISAQLIGNKDRIDDAIYILERNAHLAKIQDSRDAVEMTIFSLYSSRIKEPSNKKYIDQLAKSKRKYSQLAKELLGDLELSMGNAVGYFEIIKSLYIEMDDIFSPNQQDRIHEIYYALYADAAD